MTPDDLSTVQRSWSDLRCRRATLLGALTRRFEAEPSPIPAAQRAGWLLDAVEDLVDLLPVPSCLATRARDLGATWPDPHRAPSFSVEGRVWMRASAECLPTWSVCTEGAWRQAWLLLSDVLAEEALSPFADGRPLDDGRGC